MEEIQGDRAGDRHLAPDDVVLFPCGLPGFKEHQRFCLVHPQGLAPLLYLQSLHPPHPRFPLIPASAVDHEYQFAMEPWDRDVVFPPSPHATKPKPEAPISVYFVVSAGGSEPPTVNMLAPIVIRPDTLRGVQAVRSDRRYSHAFPLTAAARN